MESGGVATREATELRDLVLSSPESPPATPPWERPVSRQSMLDIASAIEKCEHCNHLGQPIRERIDYIGSLEGRFANLRESDFRLQAVHSELAADYDVMKKRYEELINRQMWAKQTCGKEFLANFLRRKREKKEKKQELVLELIQEQRTRKGRLLVQELAQELGVTGPVPTPTKPKKKAKKAAIVYRAHEVITVSDDE